MKMRILLPAAVAILLTAFAVFYFVRSGEVAPAQIAEDAPAEIAVTDAWARATPPGADVGAVYLTLENVGGLPDRLVGLASPVAQSAMLHRTMEENGVSTMREAEGNMVPGAKIEMKPGGTHIMLMGLEKPLTEGERISVTLDFEKAGTVNFGAQVMPIGAEGPAE